MRSLAHFRAFARLSVEWPTSCYTPYYICFGVLGSVCWPRKLEYLIPWGAGAEGFLHAKKPQPQEPPSMQEQPHVCLNLYPNDHSPEDTATRVVRAASHTPSQNGGNVPLANDQVRPAGECRRRSAQLTSTKGRFNTPAAASHNRIMKRTTKAQG